MTKSQSKKISAVIITYNEIGYIERCIASVAFADEIIVVDSYSSDGTYEFLKNHEKVTVIQHPFQDFTRQKTFALRQASNDWVFFLDADEVVPVALATEVKATINQSTDKVAFWCYRKFMFKNKTLRYSGWQTDKNYRLFRKSKVAFCQDRRVHECLEVDGASGSLNTRLLHFSYKSFKEYRQKMLYYGHLKAQQNFENEVSIWPAKLLLAPIFKFTFNYICRLGFLDGTKGVLICYLNALSDYQRYRTYRLLHRNLNAVQETSFQTLSE